MKKYYDKVNFFLSIVYFVSFYHIMKSMWKGLEDKSSSDLQLKLKIIGNVGTVAFLIPMTLFCIFYYYDF